MKIDQIPQVDPFDPSRPEDGLPEQLRFWRRSIEKHRWAIALLTVLIGAVSALVVFSLTPVYRAAATLLIEPTKSKIVNIEEVYSGISGNRDYIQTQAGILKSRELAAKLVRRLSLATNPAIDPRQRPPALNFEIPWHEWLPEGWVAKPPPVSEEAVTSAAITAVLESLDVRLVRNSFLVVVNFESVDRNLAAKVANTLAEVYIENDLESRIQMTRQAAAWLTGRAKGLREALENSERALQQFRDEEKIVDAKGVALGASGQLNSLTTTLVAARQKVAEVQNAYRQVQAVLKGESRATLESLPAIVRNPAVARFKELEAEAERKKTELSKRYGFEHPRMIAAESELRSARENTKNAADTVVSGITREYEVAKATEQSMESMLEKSKAEIQDINGKEFRLAALERDVQTNRQLYDLFVSRFRETSATGDLQSAVARVIDPAIVPDSPVRPQKGPIILISLVVGLLLGILLALLLESLDNTVRSGDDVVIQLEAPLLGFLQSVRTRHRGHEIEQAYLTDFNPAFCEEVRTLRTGLVMSELDNPHKVVLVTSSVPGEGKTTVAMNLAFALAQLKRTCLIDADLRQLQTSKILVGEAKLPGLSNLVAGTETAAACVRQHESGLFYIPSGPVPPNPLELLSSKRFAEVMATLQESFDIILLDSPPVQLVSDAVVLAGVANTLVFVVRADATPHRVARGSLDLLKKSKAQLLGVVLNQLNLEKAERYYGYGRYSGYGGNYKHYERYGSYSGKR
jgi:capsular exopolysaccharide synthesis family protein